MAAITQVRILVTAPFLIFFPAHKTIFLTYQRFFPAFNYELVNSQEKKDLQDRVTFFPKYIHLKCDVIFSSSSLELGV